MKKKKQNNQNRLMLFMVLLVAFTMLFSGFYYFSSPTQQVTEGEEEAYPYIDTYQISQIGGSSILLNVSKITTDFIAMPSPSLRITLDDVRYILNSSVEGVDTVICESTEQYVIFKFKTDGRDNITNNLNEELTYKLRDYTLLRGHTTQLNIESVGVNEVYIIGSLDTQIADYVSVFLFQRTDNGNLIGFEEKNIPLGPTINTDVVNITEIVVRGSVISDFNPSKIKEGIRVNEFSFIQPSFWVNGTLENEILEDLDILDGVYTEIEGNETYIKFNASMETIMGILDNEDIRYSLREGNLIFSFPTDQNVEDVISLVMENKVNGITIIKKGVVSLPDEIIINGKRVPIENNNAFDVALDINTGIGDNVNITVNTIQIGDQILILGAGESSLM